MASEAKFLSKAEVRSMVKLSYAELARREADGRFPQRIPLGPHRNSRRVYIYIEIIEWMEAQILLARGTAKASS